MYEIDKSKTNFICGMGTTKDVDTFLVAPIEKVKCLCMVGRSNVGKSSLINALFGKNVARTSNTPGRTREINMFKIAIRNTETKERIEFNLFDLPGYGHADVSKQMKEKWQDLMIYFFERLPNTSLLINIQDARNPGLKSDIQFQEYIDTFDLDRFLIFNKVDKLKKQSEKAKLKNMTKDLNIQSVFLTSAEKGKGIKELEEAINNKLISYLKL